MLLPSCWPRAHEARRKSKLESRLEPLRFACPAPTAFDACDRTAFAGRGEASAAIKIEATGERAITELTKCGVHRPPARFSPVAVPGDLGRSKV